MEHEEGAMPATEEERSGHTRETAGPRDTVIRFNDEEPKPEPASGRVSQRHFAGQKSIRARGQVASWSLAAKFVASAFVCMLVAILAVLYAFQRAVADARPADVAEIGKIAVSGIERYGSALLRSRAAFNRLHPDDSAPCKVADYWLAADGYIDMDRWTELTGADAGSRVPIRSLDAAAMEAELLAPMVSSASGRSGHSLAAAAVFDENRVPAAMSGKAGSRSAVPGLEPPGADSAPGDAGEDAFPYPLRTGGGPAAVRFSRRIHAGGPGSPLLGHAVAVMRIDGFSQAQMQTFYLVGALAMGILVVLSIALWLIARRTTGPMRRLVGDMHAIANEDFSRRSLIESNDEIGLLALAFNTMAERLWIARENEKENSRLGRDLAVAKEIQNALLPARTPQMPGVDIHCAYRPAKEIGGDYFDFLPVDDRRVGFVVADASGKSVPAALMMSTTRAILRFTAPGCLSAAETLAKTNAMLAADIPRAMFVSAYYMILDPSEMTLLCASAGHTPMLLARADGTVELINPGGIALGFDQGPIFRRTIREQRIGLRRGDRVVVYTDGVVECANDENEEYSERRLQEFVRQNRDRSSYDFVGTLLAALDRYRGAAEVRDDTTIVTFRVL